MQVGSATDTSTVVAALRDAASATGSDFHYLLSTAIRESSLKADARSNTSSAAGLFQFVDQTWLGLVKTHGAKYGLGAMADAISKDGEGRYHAASAADRQAILGLRTNPQIAALMAGEYSRSSAATMQAALGRPVCGGELYAAHFLGPDAACRLIRASETTPDASAAALFPAAAGANHGVFFHADGTAKSVREVYDWAMRQPGATAPVSAGGPGEALQQAAAAPAANAESLLADVMNWQPSGFFAAPSPLMLSPGLLDLLSDS